MARAMTGRSLRVV
jgi:hypothetical protein